MWIDLTEAEHELTVLGWRKVTDTLYRRWRATDEWHLAVLVFVAGRWWVKVPCT